MATYVTYDYVYLFWYRDVFDGFVNYVGLIREDGTELPIERKILDPFTIVEEADAWVVVNTEPIFFDVATTDLASPDNKVKYVGIYSNKYYVSIHSDIYPDEYSDIDFSLLLKIELPTPRTYLAGEQLTIPPYGLKIKIYKTA